VQVLGPIHSTYWWKGSVEESREWMCLMKTTSATYPQLETYLLAAHPYETPEITATPLARGSPAYLRWISAETSSRRE
jgi:periplasmic divalent cation tolerance protein